MLDAIRHNLGNLTNFTGRDGRSTFWFYVLVIVIVQIVAGVLISLPLIGGVARDAFEAASQGMSEAELQKKMFATMSGQMRTAAIYSMAVAVICGLLLVASFVRRLHDSNRPGWIAAIPFLLVLAAQALAFANMDTMFDTMASIDPADPASTMKAQQPMLMANALSWIGYLIVVVFGVWPSSDGDNRFGPEPDHL
jgi:uncharacterized membrane protein YhaH (DUF805 family)